MGDHVQIGRRKDLQELIVLEMSGAVVVEQMEQLGNAACTRRLQDEQEAAVDEQIDGSADVLYAIGARPKSLTHV